MLFLSHNLLTKSKRNFSLEFYFEKFKLYIFRTFCMYIRKQNREKGLPDFLCEVKITYEYIETKCFIEVALKVCLQVPGYKLHEEYIYERPSVIHSCIRLLLFVNFLQGNIKFVKDRKRILFLIVIPYSKIEIANKRLCFIGINILNYKVIFSLR